MLAYRNSHQNEPQRQHLLNPEKKKCSKYFKTKQGRLAFTRIREMRYRTKEILWSQFSAAQEHHTAVSTDILLEPVCMLICVHWKGGFFFCYHSKPFTQTNQSSCDLQNLFHGSEGAVGLETGLFGSMVRILCHFTKSHVTEKEAAQHIHLFAFV